MRENSRVYLISTCVIVANLCVVHAVPARAEDAAFSTRASLFAVPGGAKERLDDAAIGVDASLTTFGQGALRAMEAGTSRWATGET